MDKVSFYHRDGDITNIQIMRGDQASLRENINKYIFKQRYKYIFGFFVGLVLFVYFFVLLTSIMKIIFKKLYV